MNKLHNFLEKNIKIQPTTIVHAGVGPRPHEEANIMHQLWPDANIIGFEPTPSTYKDRLKDYPGKLYNYGLWNFHGIYAFNIAQAAGRSSFLKPHKDWKYGTPSKTIKTRHIECVTVDSFFKDHKNDEDIFLWMDVEGAELEILKGATNLMNKGIIKWVMVEVAKIHRRFGQPSRQDIENFLDYYGDFVSTVYQDGKSLQDILYART